MKDLLEKLSSYNIFNYLLPGIVFVAISGSLTTYSFVQKDVVIGIFLYYFIGLIISRIGSIIIEPMLKWIKFVKFSEYKDFIKASKEDKFLEILSETNNMYRTFCSLFLCIVILKMFHSITTVFPCINSISAEILIICLLILFLLSYRKQTSYINKRVNNAIAKD